MRTSGRAVGAVLAVVLVVVLAGCGMVEQMTWQEVPEDPVLVPIAEKDQLGWNLPSTVSRGRLQAGVLEHFEESTAALEPVIAKEVGRPVEVTAMAVRPDGLVNVIFMTTDEPVVGLYTTISVHSDGSVSTHPTIPAVDGIARETVNALYRMAYRERFAQLRDYLLTTYPQFTTLPPGYLRAHGDPDPVFGNAFESGIGAEAAADHAAETTIYLAYRQDPDRTDAEWRALFEQEAGDRLVGLGVGLVLADPQGELLEEDARTILRDLRDNPLFAGFVNQGVGIYSNLVLRDRDRFAEYWGMVIHDQQTDEADWWVTHRIYGGDVL